MIAKCLIRIFEGCKIGLAVGFAHLVRSRGAAACSQPIAAQSLGCFVEWTLSSKLGESSQQNNRPLAWSVANKRRGQDSNLR